MSKEKKEFELIWEALIPEAFHTIRYRTVGLHHAFMMVVTLATSQKDVEKVHNLLPDNCKLFQEHMSLLREVRSQMYDGDPPNNGKRPLDEWCHVLLVHACEGHDMTRWYMAHLKAPRAFCELSKILEHDIVFSHRDRQGHGGEHFFSHLFGLGVDVGIYLSDDHRALGVRIVTWEKTLTHDFVEKARSCEALMNTPHGGLYCCGPQGQDLDFWFLFEAEPFMALLDHQQRYDGDPNHGKVWVIKDGFIEKVWKALSDSGLDTNLAPLKPVLPVAKEASRGRL